MSREAGQAHQKILRGIWNMYWSWMYKYSYHLDLNIALNLSKTGNDNS